MIPGWLPLINCRFLRGMGAMANCDRLWPWLWVGVLVLPIFPALGGTVLLILCGITWFFHGKILVREELIQGLGAFGVWLIITCFFPAAPRNGALQLFNYLPLFGLFAMAALVLNKNRIPQLTYGLFLPIFAIALVGAIETHTEILIPEKLGKILGFADSFFPKLRMDSVFMNPNLCGAYGLFTWPLGLGLWFDHWQRFIADVQRKIPTPFTGKAWGSWLVVTLGLVANGYLVLFSQSRNAWIGVALVTLAFAIYCRWSFVVMWFSVAAGAIATVAFGIPTFTALVPKIISDRLSVALLEQQETYSYARSGLWEFAMQLIKEHPIVGWGLDSFSPLFQAESRVWMHHPHNAWLMWASEVGLVPTIAFTMLLGSVLWRSVKLIRYYQHHYQPRAALFLFSYGVAFLAIAFFNCFDISLFEIRLNIMAWIIFAGLFTHHFSPPLVPPTEAEKAVGDRPLGSK